MVNTIKKIAIASSLVATSLVADVDSSNKSLIGIEGGYGGMDMSIVGSSYNRTKNLQHIGLKIGAEGESYRAFISGRYYEGNQFDYANTVSFDFQYLLNFSKVANFFIGGSVGSLNFKMDDITSSTREVSTTYYGGDLGFNIHMNESFDVELGARFTNIDTTHLMGTTTYQFDAMIGGYASLIYKFDLE